MSGHSGPGNQGRNSWATLSFGGFRGFRLIPMITIPRGQDLANFEKITQGLSAIDGRNRATAIKSPIADTDSLLNSNYFSSQIQTSGSKRINSVIVSSAAVGALWRQTQRLQTVFSKRCFSDSWLGLAQKNYQPEGGENAWKRICSEAICSTFALRDPDHPLGTPLWKTPFAKHRFLLLGRHFFETR